MFCCIHCFNDRKIFLEIETSAIETGNCSFCNSKDVAILPPYQLADTLQPLIDLYTPSIQASAQPLCFFLKNDWSLFSACLDEKQCTAILNAIFPEEKLTGRHYERITPASAGIDTWERLREEIKHENRYFPVNRPDLDEMENLFGFLIQPNHERPKELYRARINTEKRPFSLSEMGKPPREKSSSGRANPFGIPYLYTASNENTAIAEIRPHKGDTVTVVKLQFTDNIVMVDLRNPRDTISPFEVAEEDLKRLHAEIDLLCMFGDELSKPIVPREANLEYLPSQYLCEMIKGFNYDGVIYKSSVGEGDNYAFFTEEKLKKVGTEVYSITHTSFNKQKY